MPRAPSLGATSITVMAVAITLDPLPSYVKVGDTVHFIGQLTVNGGIPGYPETIEIYGDNTLIASGMATVDGYYDISWTAPLTLACNTFDWKARHPDSNTYSSARRMGIAYNTRLSISAPAVVGIGVNFTVSGKLEYENPVGTWNPLSGRAVAITYDTTTLGTPTTGVDGSYSLVASISASGTFTLRANYVGEGITMAMLTVRVASVIDWWNTLSIWQKTALAGSIALGIGIGIIYMRRRR